MSVLRRFNVLFTQEFYNRMCTFIEDRVEKTGIRMSIAELIRIAVDSYIFREENER